MLRFSWVVAAFVAAMTLSVPLWGQPDGFTDPIESSAAKPAELRRPEPGPAPAPSAGAPSVEKTGEGEANHAQNGSQTDDVGRLSQHDRAAISAILTSVGGLRAAIEKLGGKPGKSASYRVTVSRPGRRTIKVVAPTAVQLQLTLVKALVKANVATKADLSVFRDVLRADFAKAIKVSEARTRAANAAVVRTEGAATRKKIEKINGSLFPIFALLSFGTLAVMAIAGQKSKKNKKEK